MSLQPPAAYPIPAATQRVARAAFPRGNLSRQGADRRGPLYPDRPCSTLCPSRGQPAEAPARLALATLLPGAEGRSARHAADAVRSRSAWQYVLGLALTDPGFAPTVRSACRARLVTGAAAPRLLETLLTLARPQGRLKTRGRQRTASTPVVAAMRGRNRLERGGEPLRAALPSLAGVAPAWGQALAPPAWSARSAPRVANSQRPKTAAARKALAAVIGADGQMGLQALDAASAQPWVPEVPAGHLLRRVWAEPDVEGAGRPRWREGQARPAPAERIASPYDAAAR
jgi:transposase